MKTTLVFALFLACVACSKKADSSSGSAAPTNTAGTLGPTVTPSSGSGSTPSTVVPVPQINLTWDAADAGQTGFVIYGSTDGVTFTQVLTVTSGTATSARIPDTGPTKPYYVKIQAVNAVGNSGFSQILTLAAAVE
jgi:hypothetical protein